ncbi:hypothetical protein GALMADRAFT_149049 [Galerina marginata CBS 339.88]|uniref:Uncharacterized protein n=1 Tax=Galerina marginata (strain CBS 339.88) TaxID=685588 RepID=A0A067SE53_GALM3|nr:hypothetical protein GALMADRAFT_149049 [Galerina marginata CBS 339.88]
MAGTPRVCHESGGQGDGENAHITSSLPEGKRGQQGAECVPRECGQGDGENMCNTLSETGVVEAPSVCHKNAVKAMARIMYIISLFRKLKQWRQGAARVAASVTVAVVIISGGGAGAGAMVSPSMFHVNGGLDDEYAPETIFGVAGNRHGCPNDGF